MQASSNAGFRLSRPGFSTRCSAPRISPRSEADSSAVRRYASSREENSQEQQRPVYAGAGAVPAVEGSRWGAAIKEIALKLESGEAEMKPSKSGRLSRAEEGMELTGSLRGGGGRLAGRGGRLGVQFFLPLPVEREPSAGCARLPLVLFRACEEGRGRTELAK